MLALRGARVVLACRSQEKGEALRAKILEEMAGTGANRQTTPSDALVVMGSLDLGSKASVESFAAEFCARALPLTGLVCCAGVVCQPFGKTRDGRETHFGVNHLGHFFLAHALLDEIVRTAASSGAQGRIVLVTSGAHHFTYRVRRGVPRPSRGIDFANLDEPVGYDAGRAYAQSKLAVALHASELGTAPARRRRERRGFRGGPGHDGRRAETRNALPGGGGALRARGGESDARRAPRGGDGGVVRRRRSQAAGGAGRGGLVVARSDQLLRGLRAEETESARAGPEARQAAVGRERAAARNAAGRGETRRA